MTLAHHHLVSSSLFKRWNFKALLLFHLIALCMLGSWLLPQTRLVWDWIDHRAFYFLNSWVRDSLFWQQFWAVVNNKMFDWVHDLVMALFFLTYILRRPRENSLRRALDVFFVALLTFITISYLNRYLISDIIEVVRKSPSLVLNDAVRLSQKVTWLKVKDHSHSSFPGDHGTLGLIFMGTIIYFMGWRWGLLAIAYGIFFCLPRLIVGAHWLTDILIGSGTIALLSISWWFYTPLHHSFVKGVEWLLRMPFDSRKWKDRKEVAS